MLQRRSLLIIPAPYAGERKMTKSNRKEVEKTLKKFKFVMWDRFVHHDKICVTFYGWIDREDSYKDFLVATWTDGEWWWVTSSAKYDQQIKEIFGEKEGIPCQRVQYHFEVKNCIKLK